jgi:RimJ/RimL family protein N-acetyltransferase
VIKLLDVYQAGAIRPGALEWLYDLIKERDPEINISHSTLPSFEQHRQFVTRRPYRFWYLIEYTPEQTEMRPPPAYFVGYISATHANEIGIVLKKCWRGIGCGPVAIRMLIALHSPNPADASVRNGHWLANIAPANEHSRHVFTSLGFRKIQETFEFQSEENTDGNQST